MCECARSQVSRTAAAPGSIVDGVLLFMLRCCQVLSATCALSVMLELACASAPQPRSRSLQGPTIVSVRSNLKLLSAYAEIEQKQTTQNAAHHMR